MRIPRLRLRFPQDSSAIAAAACLLLTSLALLPSPSGASQAVVEVPEQSLVEPGSSTASPAESVLYTDTGDPVVLGAPTVGSAIARDWLPYAESLPEFGGIWVRRANGRDTGVTLYLTGRRAEAELRSRFPEGWDLEIATVAQPLSELQRTVSEVMRTWPAGHPDVRIFSAGVDVRTNSVVVGVDDPQALAVPTTEPMSHMNGQVPIRVEAEEPILAEACTNRDSCTDPIRPGVRIYGSGQTCTMAWYSQYTHLLTAGHCDGAGAAMWSHPAWGNLGSEALNGIRPGQPAQIDAMRVVMPLGQRSNKPYGQSATMTLRRHPLGGEVVCASLGRSDANRCGTVQEAGEYTLANYNCGGCTFFGIKATIQTMAGDSGSPLWSQDFWQLGLTSAGGDGVSRYARILDAANALGSPFGNFESAQRVPGGIRVRGWSIDPDTTSPTTVRIYIDVTPFDRTAGLSRPDVGAAYKYGNNHGFDATIPVGSGPNSACVWVINQQYGSSTLLNCTNVP